LTGVAVNGLKRLSIVTVLIYLMTAVNALARGFTMAEYDQLFVTAKKIEKEEIDSLQLKGKLIGEAINILIMEGYDCGKSKPLPGFDGIIGISCKKKRAEKSCSSSAVMLHPDYNKINYSPNIKEVKELELDSFDVACYHPNYLPIEYVVNQADAEKKLKLVLDKYPLNGLNAKRAYEQLLDNHFLCGFDFNNMQSPNMRCSKIEPVNFCHDAVVMIEINWSSPIQTKNDVFKKLEDSTVIKAEPHCKIRNLQSRSKKDF
jgi:hypothetical protein